MGDTQCWARRRSDAGVRVRSAQLQTGRKQMAYHRAGHAVLAWWGHLPLDTVHLAAGEETGEAQGYTAIALPAWWPGPHGYGRTAEQEGLILRYGMLFLAGPLAEGIYREHPVWRRSEEHDVQAAYECAYELADEQGQEATVLFDWLWMRTAHLLMNAALWSWVNAVAVALLEHDRLDGAQVAETILAVARTAAENATPSAPPSFLCWTRAG